MNIFGTTAGLSAYAIAVNNGFVGTEAEWLATFAGIPGPQGDEGPEGPEGPAGSGGAFPTATQTVDDDTVLTPEMQGFSFMDGIDKKFTLPPTAEDGETYILTPLGSQTVSIEFTGSISGQTSPFKIDRATKFVAYNYLAGPILVWAKIEEPSAAVQYGIEWKDDINYASGMVAKAVGDATKSYYSRVNNNLNNPVTDKEFWTPLFQPLSTNILKVLSGLVPSINADPTKYDLTAGEVSTEGQKLSSISPTGTELVPSGVAATQYLVLTAAVDETVAATVRDTDADTGELRLATFNLTGSNIDSIDINFDAYENIRLHFTDTALVVWLGTSPPTTSTLSAWFVKEGARCSVTADVAATGGALTNTLKLELNGGKIPDVLDAFTCGVVYLETSVSPFTAGAVVFMGDAGNIISAALGNTYSVTRAIVRVSWEMP